MRDNIITDVIIGFCEKGESTEDNVKDEDIFYYLEVGDELYGDHGDFSINKVEWN